MDIKKPQGRPRKPASERRSVQINFKVTPAQEALIRKAAADYPLAAWVRSVVLTAARKEVDNAEG